MNHQDPFDLSDAIIRDFKHVRVTRIAPLDGRPCRYEKIFKSDGLGNAEYWTHRENAFLVDFALNKRLKHVVRLVNLGLGGEDNKTPVVESVVTKDAGITIEDWMRIQPRYSNGDSWRTPFQHTGVFLQLLRACLVALREIHSHGIVHCDFNAENICIPYIPYPYEGSGYVSLRFEQLQIIDFAFSVTTERPLEQPLPILPVAPYQSRLLKAALEADSSGLRRGSLAAQGLDYRVDIFGLGFLAERILETGLIQPAGSGGLVAYDGARRLVAKLKAVENGGSARVLPHAAWIEEIDSLLGQLNDLQSCQDFEVARIREKLKPYEPEENQAPYLNFGSTPVASLPGENRSPYNSSPYSQKTLKNLVQGTSSTYPYSPNSQKINLNWLHQTGLFDPELWPVSPRTVGLTLLFILFGYGIGRFWTDFQDYLADRISRETIQGSAQGPKQTIPTSGQATKQEANGPASTGGNAEQEAAARQALTNYALAVTQHEFGTALSFWKEPTDKTRNRIESTDEMAVQPGKVEYDGQRHAEVSVLLIAKRKKGSKEVFEGIIDMELSEGGQWQIQSTKDLSCTAGCPKPPAPSTPTETTAAASTSDDAKTIKAVVINYYSALNQHDTSTARALRSNVGSHFSSDVGNKEYARVSRIAEPEIYGDIATIWVDTSVKNYGEKGQTWQGTIDLQRAGGGWVITTTRGLSKVR